MQRLGLQCVQTIETDALEFEDKPYDRVIADVPCLGSGTISKKPDIKWKKDIFDLKAINELQYKLLCKASELVKLDGVVVYSTCSIEPEENFMIVEKFLKEHPDFRLQSARGNFPDEIIDEHGCIQTMPHKHKMDGAFSVKLVKAEN